jgi:hypothetical protein
MIEAPGLVHILPDVCQLDRRQGFVGGKLPHHAALLRHVWLIAGSEPRV